MVVVRKRENVYPTRREAVLAAVAKCREVARRNTERADELLDTLAK
jgi:hypothetical protein